MWRNGAAPDCIVKCYPTRRCEIQAPLAANLGDADHPRFGVSEEHPGQAGRFVPEDQDIVILKVNLPNGLRAGRFEEPEPSVAHGGEERHQVVVNGQSESRPIVHRTATQAPIVEHEPHRPDEVQPGSGCNAQPGDVAGIWGDLRMDQRQLQAMGREIRRESGHARAMVTPTGISVAASDRACPPPGASGETLAPAPSACAAMWC